MADTLLTPPEAAARLGFSLSTINQWRCKHVGPAYVRVGGRVFYRKADLDRYIAAGVVRPRRHHTAAGRSRPRDPDSTLRQPAEV